uniref:Mating pheromone receptor a2 n=2 Tax=Rhodotorula TaxID=5533 RepID=G8H2J9_9BASI|nr:mating pheromone receptor a2 [Rhodotorula araucariae]
MGSQLAYAVLSGLLVVLNIVPLYWQFVQGNSGPIAMGVWTVTGNLIGFINAVVWYNDAVDRAPVWCDIQVIVGTSVGRMAAVFCIARFLADIVSPRATAITRQDRRRRAIHDYLLSFGVPGVIMACHVLYQPNRYSLIRGVGCTATQVMTWPTLVLRTIWSPLFATGGTLYSAYTVYRLIRHRRNFGRVVAGAHSALTTSRFIRLGAVSIAYLCVGVPLSMWSTIVNVRSSGRYYDYSWAYIHSAWKVHPVTYSDAEADNLSSWGNVIVGFIFFAALGFGTEAITAYKRVASALHLRSASAVPTSHEVKRSWSHRLASLRKGQANPHHGYDQDIAPAFQISREIGVKRGIKVVVKEEQNIV